MTTELPPQDSHRSDAAERFAELFQQHGRAIYRHIRTLVPHVADVDDVFQETSVTLWQKFDQYRPDLDFRAWACRIAYYKVLKLRDRQIRSPRLFSGQFLDLISEELIVMSDMLDARSEALLLCRRNSTNATAISSIGFIARGPRQKTSPGRWDGTRGTSTAPSSAFTVFCSTASKKRFPRIATDDG